MRRINRGNGKRNGAPSECKCIECGRIVDKARGTRCINQECPNCESSMIRA